MNSFVLSTLFATSIIDDPEAPREIDRWVAALRSGKYAQGRNALRVVNDGFCCLGVYLDVCDPNGWGPDPIAGSNDAESFGYVHVHSAANASGEKSDDAPIFYLDTETRRRLHLTPTGMEKLGRLNDGTEMGPSNFAGIADLIETEMRLVTARPDRLDPISWSPASSDR